MDGPPRGFAAFLAWFGSGPRGAVRSDGERVLSGSIGFGSTLGVLLGMGVGILLHERFAGGDMLLGFFFLFVFAGLSAGGLALGSVAGAFLGAHLVGGRDAVRRVATWALGAALLFGALGLAPFLPDLNPGDVADLWVFGVGGAVGGLVAGAHFGARRVAALLRESGPPTL